MGVRPARRRPHHRLRRHGRDARAAANGSPRYVWRPGETVVAVAYDTPVVGWRGRYANTLRLWSAWATDPLRLDAFNRGDHVGAAAARAHANAISQVLYPGDGSPAGQELRLRQEYFFSSASLQDLLGRHIRQHGDVRTLADKAAIQLNDTHPSIAIPELMRLLLDEHGLPWDAAWQITTDTFSYTNHTLLPEALETWPVTLVERLLPRHMQIIHQINRAASRRAGRDARRRHAAARRGVADRRRRRPAGAHGRAGVPRLAQGERRVRAAYRADAADGVPRPAHAVSGPDRQPHQRRHLPPLAVRGESRR